MVLDTKHKASNSILDQSKSFFSSLVIHEVPSYANSFFYSFGFLLLICLALLIITGIVMLFFGSSWWNTDPTGVFVRSMHMWAAQAFAFFLVLHAFVVFSTSAFRSKGRLIWMLGSLLLFISLIQAEFGYGLRSDFSGQWRSLQGADFWNGSGLGYYLNPLNYIQLLGIHSVIIPFLLICLIFVHFSLVKMRGIAKPYRSDISYEMVKADHTALFVRGGAVIVAIIILALLFPSPFVQSVSIQSIAQSQPSTIAATLVAEFNHSSDTATYLDYIDPYKFDTRQVYVDVPYAQYLSLNPGADSIALFNSENATTQLINIQQVQAYFANNNGLNTSVGSKNPLIPLFSSLVIMAQSGLYEDSLRNASGDQTYVLRFLSDTGYLNTKADQLGITLEKYGMIKDEAGWWPPNSWWLAPLAIMDNIILVNSQNQDSIGALILALSMLFFIAFPFVPFINEIPDRLGLYKLFWKRKKI